MKALYLMLFVSGAALADDAAIVKCRALPDAARLACYDAIPVGAARASAAPAPAAAPVRAPVQDFGMEMKRPADEPKSVESTIVGTFDGWTASSRIKLANGQVWRIIDGSEAVLSPMTNPKVHIARNMFGTLFLTIEGTNHSAKVRRVE
jgi:hypothetical protein